jgi:hypothetical protein
MQFVINEATEMILREWSDVYTHATGD